MNKESVQRGCKAGKVIEKSVTHDLKRDNGNINNDLGKNKSRGTIQGHSLVFGENSSAVETFDDFSETQQTVDKNNQEENTVMTERVRIGTRAQT